MKPRVSLFVIGLAAAVLFGAVGQVFAQEASIASIPFSFTVGTKVMPAGRYEIKVTEQSVLTLTPTVKGSGIAIPVITRLAAQNADKDGRFVFDKVENNYYLSEVWFPDTDGYLLRDTKPVHTHNIVKAQKKQT